VCSISIRFPELLHTLDEISETYQSATSSKLSLVLGQPIKERQQAKSMNQGGWFKRIYLSGYN
jgi:hypothetical protein